MGVDYGIYMLGRILEAYKIGKDLKSAIFTTMISVGEPIVFAALAMTGGLAFWVISPLMFQTTMGFFLATILLLNMLGGLLLVPSFVTVVKPRFIVRQSNNFCEETPLTSKQESANEQSLNKNFEDFASKIQSKQLLLQQQIREVK
ncbi:MAG: MMPL family transporter [Deltaproteobacteria bacterium]|nr:MMPL family transporter [Deltaproteobacteria bacterium]